MSFINKGRWSLKMSRKYERRFVRLESGDTICSVLAGCRLFIYCFVIDNIEGKKNRYCVVLLGRSR